MRILGFGEVLWDVFPDKRVIGGAPFNFCAHAVKLGARADFVSAVGADELGRETREKLRSLGVGDRFVTAADAPTGVCMVTLDSEGRPSYELRRNVAYDRIAVTEQDIAAIRGAGYDAFYLGTLAARDELSRASLRRILSGASFRHIVFDVNIRQSFYDDDILRMGLQACTILKMSRDEIPVLSRLVNRKPEDGEALCRMLAQEYGIGEVLLTLDKDGAMVFTGGRALTEPNPWDEVVSTVGGGDSFTAAYVYYRLAGRSPEDCIRRALILSSYVVSRTEAIPEYEDWIKAKLSE